MPAAAPGVQSYRGLLDCLGEVGWNKGRSLRSVFSGSKGSTTRILALAGSPKRQTRVGRMDGSHRVFANLVLPAGTKAQTAQVESDVEANDSSIDWPTCFGVLVLEHICSAELSH